MNQSNVFVGFRHPFGFSIVTTVPSTVHTVSFPFAGWGPCVAFGLGPFIAWLGLSDAFG